MKANFRDAAARPHDAKEQHTSRRPGHCISTVTAALLSLALPGFLCACSDAPEPRAAAKAPSAPASFTELEVPPGPKTKEPPKLRAALYERVFPGSRFEAYPVPKELQPSGGEDDDYVVAREGGGALAGYLREVRLSVGEREMTLALGFAPDMRLIEILPITPLTDARGRALSQAQLAQLLQLAQAPPDLVVEARSAEELVEILARDQDALTAGLVREAPRLIWHIVALNEESRRIIQTSPMVWDRARLQQMLSGSPPEYAVARGLARILPTLDSEEGKKIAYRRMSSSYAHSVSAGEKPQPEVEAVLLNPPIKGKGRRALIADGCYLLADAKVRLGVAQRCAEQLELGTSAGGLSAAVARLRGTVLLEQNRPKDALRPLRRAAEQLSREEDPRLHARLALAELATGNKDAACARAKELFVAFPKLPDIERALRACTPGESPSRIIENLQERQKRRLLASRIGGDHRADVLSLEDSQLKIVELDPAERGKVTVLIFFSTWCAHCRGELPQVSELYTRLEELDLEDRVRFVGVRTAVEREQISYEQFREQVHIEFPVYVDATMSLAFGHFTKSHGRRPVLPTIAVVDPKGVVRFFLEPGAYSDIARELRWAVEAVLGNTG